MHIAILIENFINTISRIMENYGVEILLTALLILLISIVVLICASIKMNRTTKIYKRIIETGSGIDLERFLTENLEMFYDVSDQMEKIRSTFDDFKSEIRLCYKKTGIVRYDAFEDMGGKMSFAIALLDDKNNGFILNSIHGRSENRTYLKPLINGGSEYQLSDEEKAALEKALNKLRLKEKF